MFGRTLLPGAQVLAALIITQVVCQDYSVVCGGRAGKGAAKTLRCSRSCEKYVRKIPCTLAAWKNWQECEELVANGQVDEVYSNYACLDWHPSQLFQLTFINTLRSSSKVVTGDSSIKESICCHLAFQQEVATFLWDIQ